MTELEQQIIKGQINYVTALIDYYIEENPNKGKEKALRKYRKDLERKLKVLG